MANLQHGGVFVYNSMPSCVFWLMYLKHTRGTCAAVNSFNTNLVCVRVSVRE